MAKKSVVEQFRAFVKALPGESNEPMTRGEIATAMAKKKRKAVTKKRSSKPASKTKAAKKPAKKITKRRKKEKRG